MGIPQALDMAQRLLSIDNSPDRQLDVPSETRKRSQSTTPSTASSSPVSSLSSSSSTTSGTTRRPFRVASRRRLPSTVISSTATTTTVEPPTTTVFSEEYLQDIDDNESTEDSTILDRPAGNRTKTRRPLLLKEESADQNPSATNEDERKRHSKKYSSSFKQNQLEEVLKQREKLRSSQEEVEVTTTETAVKSTIDDNDAETALAIAAHQLLSAPPPSVPNYDIEPKTSKKTTKPTTIHEYQYTSPVYEEYTTKNRFNESPVIKTTLGTEFAQTTGSVFDVSTPFVKTSTRTPYPSTSFRSRVSRPAGFTTAGLLSTISPFTPEFSRTNPTSDSRFSVPQTVRITPSSGFTGVSSTLNPSTARYVGSTDKLIPVPAQDYSFTTGGYSSIGQEPAYFTREYLLESPVTKTYDDEYQYLSPTTPVSTTRQIPRKITYRKISTTIRPPVNSYRPEVKPRRVPAKKPFEKVPVKSTKYKPVENYDYYDDGAENVATKYMEGTKVVLHSKGIIECLDIGNFPHPSSCKKFISCARLENGSFLGWEYICPDGLSFDPIGGICNWSAGLGCHA